MIQPNDWVIVPVKSFAGAKRRLSPLLSVAERTTLARTMLGDVLGATAGVPGLRNVAVVTSADDVADYARQLGVIVIDDYGHWEGCRKAVDEYLAKLGEPVLMSHIDYTGRAWVRL